MILTKFDHPVKILRVKSDLLEIWRVKETFQGSNGHPGVSSKYDSGSLPKYIKHDFN
jgi:hypothetical protein